METGFQLEFSPFTSRLNSNYVATDSESLEIQTLLKGPTSRLSELSIRLQELNKRYTQVQNEQSSLLLSISKHRALISIFRRLPIDILQKMFIACLPISHNAVMSVHEPPILLTHVCSLWRNLAHATPRLWQSIHIAVPCNTPGMFAIEYSNYPSNVVKKVARRRAEAVLEWLTRSATCPLDISVGQWGNGVPDGFYDSIIDHLIRFSERWREVSFSAPYLALIPMAVLPTSKVPLLESLNLNCVHSSLSPAIPAHLDSQSVWITSGVMKAPQLRVLRLTQLNEDATRLPINWSQLTSLSVEGIFWDTLYSLTAQKAYEILSSCRNLVRCRLEIVSNLTDYNQPLFSECGVVSLPFLTKFSVCEDTSLSQLFILLHLPALKALEFHTTIWPTQESTTSLLHLLRSSQNMIQDLTTDAHFFKRQDFIKCLRLCPLLKSLTIRRSHSLNSPPPPWLSMIDIPYCRIDDAFLEMFTSSSSSNDEDSSSHGDDTSVEDSRGYLCPNLEDFESVSETAFSEKTLLRFIKMKNGDNSSGEPPLPGLAKLKTLIVDFHWPPDDINQDHELYKQAGLVATISYPPSPTPARFSPFDGLPNTNQSGYFY